MQAKITITSDTLTPGLQDLIRRGENTRSIMEAGANELAQITKAAFSDVTLRPSPWAPTKQPNSPLRRSGRMWQSIRPENITNTKAMVATDAPYAAPHQFGSRAHVISARVKKALFWPGAKHPVKSVKHPGLPPRPFFPFDSSGNMTPVARERVLATMSDAVRVLLKL